MKIRLRYWCPIGNVMVDDMCIMQTAFNELSVADQHSAKAHFSPLLYRILSPCAPGTVMLWTGLRDKNGKDIYEGDIVRAWSEGQQAVLLVKWSVPTARFFLHRERGGIVWNLSGGGEDNRSETVEVIGNVYEHPELLASPSA